MKNKLTDYLGDYIVLAACLIWAPLVMAQNAEHVAQLKETRLCDECDLAGADLSGVDLGSSVNANDTDFAGANLSGLKINNSNMNRSNFKGANLANIEAVNLGLFRADLTNANLQYAYLPAVNLTAADLTGADFTGAIFSFDRSSNRFNPGSQVDLLTGVEAILCNTTMPDGTINNDSCPAESAD